MRTILILSVLILAGCHKDNPKSPAQTPPNAPSDVKQVADGGSTALLLAAALVTAGLAKRKLDIA